MTSSAWRLSDAGHAVLELLAAAVADQHAGRPAPVTGDDDVAIAGRADADGIQEADGLDVPGQLIQPVQAVEVVRVRVEQIQRQPGDLLLGSVQI